LAPWSSG